MSEDTQSAVDTALIGERRHLLSLAFRMLGTVVEAEDAVQETYVRWYRMDQAERDQVQVPRAWLTRVASRICLDMLGSARGRRERYVGPWLPEPVPTSAFTETGPDPLDQVTLDDSVSTAFLVVLEAMTPAERVAFVLTTCSRCRSLRSPRSSAGRRRRVGNWRPPPERGFARPWPAGSPLCEWF
jgi:DNA-directed RNA polymerase specialized sigma24 family protein